MFALGDEMGWKSLMQMFLGGAQPCTFERDRDCQPEFSFSLLLLPRSPPKKETAQTKWFFSGKESQL